MFLAHLKNNTSNNVATAAAAAVEPTTAADSRPADIVTIKPKPAAVPVVVVKPAEPAAVAIPDAVRFESIETLKPLQGKPAGNGPRSGDFVYQTQTMDKTFVHVSTGWTQRLSDPNDTSVMTFDDTLEHIERERGNVRDILLDYSRFNAVADSNGFGLIDKRTGERFTMSSDALDQFAERTRIGKTLPRRLAAGDEADRETLAIVATNGLRKLGEKPCLLRTRSDGSIRAFLSDEYAVIDHRWYLETLRRIIPGGIVSHFRSPDRCNSIFFNVLIPDSIRKEIDSDYGGMLACGNGETGHNRVRSLPSIFRAICMNGCIWDQIEGIGYLMQVHRGGIDLDALAADIRDNLQRQIPLLGSGIDSMLSTRSIYIPNAEPLQVIGATLQALAVPGITRNAADAILKGFENQRTDTGRVSAFDVIQGMTYAAQEFSAELQETVERSAGAAMLWTADRWESVFAMSRSVDSKQLKRIFSASV